VSSSLGEDQTIRPGRDHARDEKLLTEALHDVIRASDGDSAVELLDDAVALGRAARGGDEAAAERLAELVAGLDLHRTEVLVRSLTRWFQLVNLAEDNERVRRIRGELGRKRPKLILSFVRQNNSVDEQAFIEHWRNDQMAELLLGLGPELPPRVVRRIVERAGGSANNIARGRR